MERSSLLCLFSVLVFAGGVGAHPGDVDRCGGHETETWVAYPSQAGGQPTVPSEPGEYHFHFTPAQMEEEVLPSLRASRQQAHRPADDFGSFHVANRTYDILQYTRQGEAILHCQGDDEVTHTGIARIRVTP